MEGRAHSDQPTSLIECNAGGTLASVELASLCSVTEASHKVKAWVVAFEAKEAHPTRFVYTACGARMDTRRCWVSVDKGNACGHGVPKEEGIPMYRLKLLLCDESGPLWVKIFNAMESLTSIPPADFVLLPEDLQEQLIEESIKLLPFCAIDILVHQDIIAVKSLQVLGYRKLKFCVGGGQSNEVKVEQIGGY